MEAVWVSPFRSRYIYEGGQGIQQILIARIPVQFDPEWQNNPAFDELSSFDDAMLSDKSLEALKSDLEKGYLVVRLQLLGQRLKEHPNHANVANWIAEFERTKVYRFP